MPDYRRALHSGASTPRGRHNALLLLLGWQKVMKRINFFGLAVLILVASILAVWVSSSSQSLLDDLNESIAGPIKSISLCPVESDTMPAKCVGVDKVSDVIGKIRHAEKSLAPSHAITRRKFLLKIVNGTASGETYTNCFMVNEFEGTKSKLYISRIDTGENCTGPTISYKSGSVRIDNFLTP